MTTSAQKILSELSSDTKLGDLRKLASEIKKDHALAMELWASGNFNARLLSILIMDKKELSAEVVDSLFTDASQHEPHQRNQLVDWFMANQLMKDRKTIAMIKSWEDDASAMKRRIFWYYQARLRWVGQKPPADTETLLDRLEKKIGTEHPDVQWAMNLTAGWIGVFDDQYRERCIAIGEKTGLYKGDMVSKGCTPSYLPEFIGIEAGKRGL